jgi:hypothetical protein
MYLTAHFEKYEQRGEIGDCQWKGCTKPVLKTSPNSQYCADHVEPAAKARQQRAAKKQREKKKAERSGR